MKDCEREETLSFSLFVLPFFCSAYGQSARSAMCVRACVSVCGCLLCSAACAVPGEERGKRKSEAGGGC